MKRTEGLDHINNTFQEENLSQGREGTEVTSDWCNNVQEELCNFIESQGITLNGSDYTQLTQALQSFSSVGGSIPTPTTLDNNSGPLDINGITFDKTVHQSLVVDIDIIRRTDTEQFREIGKLYLTHDDDNGAEITISTMKDDAEVSFSADLTGDTVKAQYTTTNMAGAKNYETLKATNIKLTKI